MANNQCPLCSRWYCDDKITAMNLDEPEYKGYCRKCRKGIKKFGFEKWCIRTPKGVKMEINSQNNTSK